MSGKFKCSIKRCWLANKSQHLMKNSLLSHVLWHVEFATVERDSTGIGLQSELRAAMEAKNIGGRMGVGAAGRFVKSPGCKLIKGKRKLLPG